MTDTEKGHRWWLRYVIVPLIGGGGMVALVVAWINRPTAPKPEPPVVGAQAEPDSATTPPTDPSSKLVEPNPQTSAPSSEPSPATGPSAQISYGSIALQSDADCHLTIDDQDKGLITSGSPVIHPLEFGTHRVRCISRENDGVAYDRQIEVNHPRQEIKITLAQQLENIALAINTWQALQGSWQAERTDSKKIPQVNCKQFEGITAQISVDEIDGHIAKGKFHESYRRRSALIGDFPFNEAKYCHNIINDNDDVSLYTLERSGTVTFDLTQIDEGTIAAVLDVTGCYENGQSCSGSEFGEEDVDAMVVSSGDKLILDELTYQRP